MLKVTLDNLPWRDREKEDSLLKRPQSRLSWTNGKDFNFLISGLYFEIRSDSSVVYVLRVLLRTFWVYLVVRTTWKKWKGWLRAEQPFGLPPLTRRFSVVMAVSAALVKMAQFPTPMPPVSLSTSWRFFSVAARERIQEKFPHFQIPGHLSFSFWIWICIVCRAWVWRVPNHSRCVLFSHNWNGDLLQQYGVGLPDVALFSRLSAMPVGICCFALLFSLTDNRILKFDGLNDGNHHEAFWNSNLSMISQLEGNGDHETRRGIHQWNSKLPGHF